MVEQKLALGTVQFGIPYGIANKSEAVVPLEEVRKILDEACAIGIDTLDTAIGYGKSESILGQLDPTRFRLVTKLPSLPSGVMDIELWVLQQVQASLSRLGLGRLHGLLLHKPSDLLGDEGIKLYKAMINVRDQGLVNKIGVSVYSPSELDSLFTYYDLDLVQAPLNILDTRMIDSGWCNKLSSRNVEFHSRSVFLQGLLLLKAADRPHKFQKFSTVWQCWDGWLQDTNVSALQACLRFVLSISEVSKTLVGVDNRNQLKAIAFAAAGALPSKIEWPPFDSRLIDPSTWGTL